MTNKKDKDRATLKHACEIIESNNIINIARRAAPRAHYGQKLCSDNGFKKCNQYPDWKNGL